MSATECWWADLGKGWITYPRFEGFSTTKTVSWSLSTGIPILGDAWEWAENPYYPLKFSTYAYQMGVNFIIYAMSH